MKTYDPSQVAVIIGGSILNDWNTVSISRDEDSWTFTSGTQGEVTRTKNLNKLGGFVVTLPQTSPDNAILSAFELSGGIISCAVLDKSGLSIALMPEGTVVKPSDQEYGKESGEREWTIKGRLPDPLTIAGN